MEKKSVIAMVVSLVVGAASAYFGLGLECKAPPAAQAPLSVEAVK